MAAAPSTNVRSREGRQKTLEGLWMIGLDPGMISVSPDLDENAFLKQLHDKGVNDDFIRRAMAGVDWRAAGGQTPLSVNVMNLLRASGYRNDEVDRFYNEVVQAGAADDPAALMAGLTTIFGDRTAGAMMTKATGGKPPQGAIWNPYRTDAPPAAADTRYGGGGIPAALGTQDLAAGPAGTKVAQLGQLPAPPTPVQQKQAAAKAPPGGPTISGQTPGPTGPVVPAAAPGAGTTPAAVPLTPAQISANLKRDYGWAAALADIPEVNKILTDVANGTIDETEANNRWLASDYYKTTTVNEREWNILKKSSPGEAASQLEAQVTGILGNADRQGVTIDPGRARQIAETSKAHGWSDQQVNAAIASEIHYDPTGAKTGVLAAVKASQQAQLVPLSDQAMTQWAQAIVGGSKTQADFDAYLKDQAKSLFPTLATYLDTTPGGSVRHYLDPYGQQVQKTLGINPADIDWTDPKWLRFVNQADPKTGERGVMSLADVPRTLMSDPQYNFDQTENGKQQKAGLARTILSQWGYLSPSGANSGGGF